jgi:pimeloyl-ACP methyl ester carboxylesterase
MMWRPQSEALQDELLVLAPDLPGFGRSRLERGGLDAAVDACATLLRSRDLQTVVVGISYRGSVAATLAAAHSDLVAGLVISGVACRSKHDRRCFYVREHRPEIDPAEFDRRVDEVALLGRERRLRHGFITVKAARAPTAKYRGL